MNKVKYTVTFCCLKPLTDPEKARILSKCKKNSCRCLKHAGMSVRTLLLNKQSFPRFLKNVQCTTSSEKFRMVMLSREQNICSSPRKIYENKTTVWCTFKREMHVNKGILRYFPSSLIFVKK